jgi:(p)ppGpp synthase/HD superfamily hydrolase
VRFATRLGFSYVAEELQNLSFYFKSDRDLYPKIREAIESKESFIMERLKFYEMDINKSFEKTEFSSTTIHLYHRKEYEIYTLTNQFQNIDKLPDFVTCILAVPVNENYELRKAAAKLINQFGHSNVSNYQEGKKHLGEYEFDTIQIRVKKPELDNLDITIMSSHDHDILENFVNVPIKEKRIKKKVEGISEEQLELWSDWMELIILEKGENAIKDIWDSLDKNLFEEKILCFSVDQKAIYLPRGSTVLDFAFAISPDTGIHFNGARIQENVYDVYYKLSGNETIQILKSKKITASPEWRNFISDYRALGYFFNFLKNREFNSSEISISDKPTILPLPEIQNINLTLKQGFTGKIIIKGNDRKHLLKDISKAIGDSEIRKSTIQGSDTSKQFEGVFEVYFENAKSCNHVMMQLLNIRNVKSAELVKINLN